jgi:hypothetical protein
VAWQCYQQLRSIYHATHPATGRAIAEKVNHQLPAPHAPSRERPTALPPSPAGKGMTTLSDEEPERPTDLINSSRRTSVWRTIV